MEHKWVEWAQGSAWDADLGQFFLSVLSMDSAGFPVALSWPQCLKFVNVWTLRDAETYFTLITQYWSLKQSAVYIQHMSNLYIIWFKEKCFLECLCMNLNFKLFLFFIKSTDLFWEKSYVNIWFISSRKKRFMCGYIIMFLTEEMYCKTEAHPSKSEYLLYECIIRLFWIRSNVHLHEPCLRFHCFLFIAIVLLAHVSHFGQMK